MNSTNIENKAIVTQVIGYCAGVLASILFLPQLLYMQTL